MTKKEIIAKTVGYAQKTMGKEGTGHDWWHVERVWKNAIHIGKKEKADLFIVELAALLHDVADWKFHSGDNKGAFRVTSVWLDSIRTKEKDVQHVCEIIDNISFKGGTVKARQNTIEGKVVQDADRLDALGAIGIARVFAFGGHAGREIYNPNIKPRIYKSFKEVKKSLTENTSINHFYEKLLKLKGLMNTKTGREIAEKRHEFMEKYLEEFYKEWEGKI